MLDVAPRVVLFPVHNLDQHPLFSASEKTPKASATVRFRSALEVSLNSRFDKNGPWLAGRSFGWFEDVTPEARGESSHSLGALISMREPTSRHVIELADQSKN